MLLPREHGAWGLLLQPFLAGVILAGELRWSLLPALGLVLFGFILREPLVILARQRFVWKVPNPQTPEACRWLGWEVVAVLVSAAWLGRAVPVKVLAGGLAGAALFTGFAVWVTVRNRQRSSVFQCLTAIALTGTGPFAVWVLQLRVPAWSWALWTLLGLHAVAAIFVVHARLERRAARVREADGLNRAAWVAQAVQVLAAVLFWLVHPALALPPLFTGVTGSLELLRLRSEASLKEPLTRVGFRTLAISLFQMGLTIAVLYPLRGWTDF